MTTYQMQSFDGRVALVVEDERGALWKILDEEGTCLRQSTIHKPTPAAMNDVKGILRGNCGTVWSRKDGE